VYNNILSSCSILLHRNLLCIYMVVPADR